MGSAVNKKVTKAIRAAAGEPTEDKLEEILHPVKVSAPTKLVSIRMLAKTEKKDFYGTKTKERKVLVMKALDVWYVGKEAVNV